VRRGSIYLTIAVNQYEPSRQLCLMAATPLLIEVHRMIPFSRSTAGTRILPTLKARFESAIELLIADSDRLRREHDLLGDENRRLTVEVARLAEQNQALREAASIWIRMYESQLARANQAVSDLAREGRGRFDG
jgi:hypothetical protein